MIKAVIFDVGGVLLRLGEEDYRRDVARSLGLPDLGDYEKDVPDVQTGRVAEDAVWQRIAGRAVDTTKFDAYWESHFPPNEGMLKLACTLRKLGIQTAVLSNTQPSHVRVMHKMGFLQGFAPVAFSCEIGFRKPEPGAFQWMIRALGLPPEKIVHIDDIPEYIAAAKSTGIHAIQHAGDLQPVIGELDRLCDGKLRPVMEL